MRRIISGTLFVSVFVVVYAAHAATPEELQSQIDSHNAAITQLNNEIAQYEKQLVEVGSKKQTLQNALTQIDITRKKITASINVTKNKISATQLEIQELAEGIEDKEDLIEVDQAGLAEALRLLDEAETMTLIEAILSSENLTVLWNDMESNKQLQVAVNRNIADLTVQKESLATTKQKSEEKKTELLSQQKNLVSQQGSLDAARRAQNDLLSQTKAQESNYQALLAQKKAQQASFEQALNDLQEKLRVTVNPSSITPAGKGILRWPVDSVKVTQNFGNTAFALSGAYNGKGHNGIDLRATIGTPIKAALTGTVSGTGNTDSVRGCYSYGKWVLIKHSNGLSTLYAHLSQIGVSPGQEIGTGGVIGYSGETGYATGPHLHFGVYAASAVQIITLGSATNSKTPCASAIMPVAPLSGYLNPMDYL